MELVGWMKNIGSVVVESDTAAKCNWFSYLYVAAVYALAVATVLYVFAIAAGLSPLKTYLKVWQVAAGAALVFTGLFYVSCQRSLPRLTVL